VSRYKVTLQPQGAIARDLDVAINMVPAPEPAAEPAPACTPNPGPVRMWDGSGWNLTERTEYTTGSANPIYMKVLGELCGLPVDWTIVSEDGWALSDMVLIDGPILVFDAGRGTPTTITWKASVGGRDCGSVTLHISYG